MCILLTLLHLGSQSTCLRPRLPAFPSPNVAEYPIDLHPTTTPEQALKAILNWQNFCRENNDRLDNGSCTGFIPIFQKFESFKKAPNERQAYLEVFQTTLKGAKNRRFRTENGGFCGASDLTRTGDLLITSAR